MPPGKLKEIQRENYEKHKEERIRYAIDYYYLHREEKAEYKRKYHEKNREKLNQQRAESRDAVNIISRQKIAAFYNREVDCMLDLTPDAEIFGVKLTAFPHAGPLEIDHILGNVSKENGDTLAREINKGKRSIDGLRLLCRVHNRLYNPRGDSKMPSATGNARKHQTFK